MTLLPKWAIAPQHEGRVVASDEGWVVEDTGEILVSFKNLPAHLAELHSEIEEFLEKEDEELDNAIADEESVEVPKDIAEEKPNEFVDGDSEPTPEEPEKVEQPKASKPQGKKRGRKAKSK